MSRPRFGIFGGTRNEILQSVQRQGHSTRLRKEAKARHEIEARANNASVGQYHLFDTKPNDYLGLNDDSLAGVVEIGILKSNGQVDESISGPMVVGDREHNIESGRLRIISKQAVDANLIPILEEKRYKDAVLQALLTDRTGRVARMFLSKDRYDSLAGGRNEYKKYVPDAPDEIVRTNGQVQFFTLYHSSSKEFSLGLMKISLLIDRTAITFDDEVMEWLDKYAAGGGKVVSSAPRV
jgi:hypothetical protein